MAKEYAKDLEDYRKIKAMYEGSLTEQQKIDIKRVKEEMTEAKEKRKLKAVSRKLTSSMWACFRACSLRKHQTQPTYGFIQNNRK